MAENYDEDSKEYTPEETEQVLKSKAKSKDGFKDITGNFPAYEYTDTSSVNKTARGIHTNELYIGGGYPDFNLDLKELSHSEYSLNQVRETISGHVTEVDDTPNNERLLWKHKSGSGVEMRPDGTVIVSSKHNTIHITGGDQKVLIEGDGDVHYIGNLKLHVAGDFDVEVGGNYNLRVHGDKNEEIYGGASTKISENKIETVTGNKSTFVAKTNTDTYLKDNNVIVKGNQTERVGQKQSTFVGDDIIMTAPNEINISSNSMNLASKDMSVISTTGVIGGDNVINYAKNYYGTSATFTDGVTAPTFHGDLKGTANKAIEADTAYYHPASAGGYIPHAGSSPGYSITDTPTDTTVRSGNGTDIVAPGPTEALMDQYLTQSDKGTRNVQIDPGDTMVNTIDRSNAYNGVSKYALTTEKIRSKLRDPNTARNSKFIGRAISEGVLNPSYVNQVPQKFEIGLIYNQTGTPKLPQGKLLGNEETKLEKISTEANTIATRTLIPNQLYNPELQYLRNGIINGKTKLANGISLAKFLGGSGDPVTLDHVVDDTERLKIARNLYVHAEFMKSAQEFLDQLNVHRLVVAEGFYKKQEGEKLDPDGLNYLATKGQVVVYELRDRSGQIDAEYTFELAVYCKDYINFDKMILDYDSYNPDGSLNSQIIIQMPPVGADWSMRYRNQIETRFNNYTQTNGELVEITDPSVESI